MFKPKFLPLILFQLFNHSFSHAKPLMIEKALPSVEENSSSPFLAPNELFPEDGKTIYELNRGEVYISVGTERGFIGAGLSNAKRLILIDYSSDVVRFNRMNSLLLKISENREQYVQLRMDPEKWPNETFLKENKDWWLKKVVKNPDFYFFHRPLLGSDQINDSEWSSSITHTLKFWFPVFNTGEMEITNLNEVLSTLDSQKLLGFHQVNYLVEDKYFNILHNLAVDEQIESHLFDLDESAEVLELRDALIVGNEKIGVLDLSNCWDFMYLHPFGIAQIVDELKPAMIPDSILMMTGMHRGKGFNYHGYRFSFLQEKGELNQIAEFLKEENGRFSDDNITSCLDCDPRSLRLISRSERKYFNRGDSRWWKNRPPIMFRPSKRNLRDTLM